MSTPSRDHQHRDDPALRAGGEARDPLRGVGLVGGHDHHRLAGDRLQPRGELDRVLLVDRDDEPARVGVVAGADLREPRVGVAQHAAHPVAAASSAVRRRRASSARGSTTEKSARRRRPSLIHSMSPS